MFLPREELEAIRNSALKVINEGIIDEDEIKNIDADHLRAHAEVVGKLTSIYIKDTNTIARLKSSVIKNASTYVNKVIELRPKAYFIYVNSVVVHKTKVTDSSDIFAVHVCYIVYNKILLTEDVNSVKEFQSNISKESFNTIFSGMCT